MRTIDYFDKMAKLHPNRDVLVAGETRHTYREMETLTHRLAGALAQSGMQHQEPIAIMSPNDSTVLTAMLGCWRAGAIWIPVNTRNALDANIAYLKYVRVSMIFYHSGYAKEAEQIKREVPTVRQMVCLDASSGGDQSLEDFMKLAPSDVFPDQGDPIGNPEDVTALIATGGTTGPAKGVRVMNRSWGAMLETICNIMPAKNPVCLATAPLTHAAGPVTMAALAMGATVVVLPTFDAEAVMKAIQEHKVTHMFLPPTALYAMLAHPKVKDFDYSSLKYFLLAGSPVAGEKLKQAVEIFGPCMCQSYGQTEFHLVATWLSPEVVAAAARGEHPERLTSCGEATYSVRVELMDDDGNILPTGEVGEIVGRGAIVGGGYFEMPEASAEAIEHGWHHTGDVGKRDEHGFYYIVDRKKDMIVSGGFNVFSAEVEDAVMELAEVRECAVIGVPHDKWGEQVTAMVVKDPAKDVSADTIIAHVKARIGSVKAPKEVHFIEAIPRTAVGKMDKKKLREPFWGGSGRAVN